MSEEIIIDGVDVSECRLRYYPSTQCNAFKLDNSGFHQGHCKQNPNCYYKQLKRLQKENKKLKESINEAKIEYENLLINRNDFAERTEKYKLALEEIREQYVNKVFFKCDKTEEECPCHNCIILGQLDRVQNIIKIIDEVLK